MSTSNLLERVAAVLAEQPDATVDQVQRAVRARRSAVLAAVQTVRSAQQPDLTPGTGGNRAEPSSRHLLTEREASNVTDSGDYPTREDFEEVARLLREPATRLLEITDKLQRHAHYRSTVAPTYDALGDLLTFTGTFEETLRGLAEQADRLHADLEPIAREPQQEQGTTLGPEQLPPRYPPLPEPAREGLRPIEGLGLVRGLAE